MSVSVDVFWSFRSPYSYFVTPDLIRLRQDFDVDLHLRPVLPIAVRAKETLFSADQRRVQYIIRDASRRAEFLGMKYGFPSPDPIVQDLKTFEVAESQPYIFRLTGLGIEAARRGRGVEFAYQISHLIWSGEPGWDKGDKLDKATAAAGLDLAELDAAILAEDPRPKIEANHAALEAAGHWGVPTMVLDDEPFFGQDRVDTLRWRLEKLGLARS
ncbi:MAG: 2-hydroxychromene-2-carboxylate isomerase [Porticoccaceae bacterium]